MQNKETNILTNEKMENSDIGGISKEDFKKQIQARKNIIIKNKIISKIIVVSIFIYSDI